MQIAKADLGNHDLDFKTDENDEGEDRIAPVRESGTAYEPETSNFHHYGEPAPVRPPLGEDTE